MTDPLTAALFFFDIEADGRWKCGACGKLFIEQDYAAHVLSHQNDPIDAGEKHG